MTVYISNLMKLKLSIWQNDMLFFIYEKISSLI